MPADTSVAPSNQSEFTHNADIAFDEFCRKYFNSSNGFFVSSMRKSTRKFGNPSKPPHVKDIFNIEKSTSGAVISNNITNNKTIQNGDAFTNNNINNNNSNTNNSTTNSISNQVNENNTEPNKPKPNYTSEFSYAYVVDTDSSSLNNKQPEPFLSSLNDFNNFYKYVEPPKPNEYTSSTSNNNANNQTSSKKSNEYNGYNGYYDNFYDSKYNDYNSNSNSNSSTNSNTNTNKKSHYNNNEHHSNYHNHYNNNNHATNGHSGYNYSNHGNYTDYNYFDHFNTKANNSNNNNYNNLNHNTNNNSNHQQHNNHHYNNDNYHHNNQKHQNHHYNNNHYDYHDYNKDYNKHNNNNDKHQNNNNNPHNYEYKNHNTNNYQDNNNNNSYNDHYSVKAHEYKHHNSLSNNKHNSYQNGYDDSHQKSHHNKKSHENHQHHNGNHHNYHNEHKHHNNHTNNHQYNNSNNHHSNDHGTNGQHKSNNFSNNFKDEIKHYHNNDKRDLNENHHSNGYTVANAAPRVSKFKNEFLNARKASLDKENEVVNGNYAVTTTTNTGSQIPMKSIVNNFGLKVVACGMRKDTRLPIPKANYFIDRGNFGDDAGFWSENDNSIAIGLADGATGNIMLGYDPGDFPRHLMKLCSTLFVESNSYNDPKDLLMKAFDLLQDKTCYGSCTACILTFDKEQKKLNIANIGDSGYRLLRDGKIIRKSEPQRISHDCPRQLDSYPWKAESRKMGVSYTEILGSETVCDSVKVMKDDVVILSSDGLYDNLEDDEIEDIFNKSKSVGDAAEKMVTHSIKYNKKPDDILIIIGKIVETNKATTRYSIYSKEPK